MISKLLNVGIIGVNTLGTINLVDDNVMNILNKKRK